MYPQQHSLVKHLLALLCVIIVDGYGLRAAFAEDTESCKGKMGQLLVTQRGGLCIGGTRLRLMSWGDEASHVAVGTPEQVVMDREGARWQHRSGLEEWHKASASGVSHGWVVHAPMHPMQRELILTLEAPGATPRVRDAQSVVWEDGRGQARFDYSGLVAWDSEGRLLEARMEPHQGALRIKVDVTRASWPVTIDPVATAVITPPLTEANQRFGGAIAAHKEMVAVGAPGLAGGRVYIYRPNAPGAAQWSLLQELNGRLDANTLNIDQFGIAMDMKEDWLVVGTLGTGAYIYNRQNNNTWSMFKSIPSSSSFVTNGTYDSNLLKLGTTVKFIDDYLFITSKSDVSVVSTGDIISNSGVVAVYHKDTPSANNWGRVNVIFDTVPEINKEFGSTISGHGDWLIVSASRNNYVSLFKKNPSNLHLWNEHDKLVFPPVITPRSLNTYISSSDMKNGKMVFGIPSEANIFPNRSFPTSSSIGAVYYYEFDPLSQKWIYKQAFQPDIVSTYRSLFGLSVKIEGKTIVVGSPYYLNSQPNITHQNPVFIYKQNKNGTWIEDFLNTNLSATRALGTKTFLTDGVLYASDVSHDNIGAVHVRDFNTAPSVEAQQLRVMEGESGMLTLDVYDTEHEQLEVSLVQGPVRGNFQLVDGVLSYSAERSGPYTDTITYKVSDGKLETLGSVSIEVVNVNDPPVALAQQLVGAEDTALMVTLTGEDPDEGTQLGFEIVRGPEHGALMGQGATRTYMPAPNFSGEDSLTFKVSDGMVESAVAEVRIQVAPVNDPPVFVEPLHEGATRSEDGATIDLTFRAMDIDSGALVWSATGLPTNATFEAGRFVWTPTEAQQGTHNFELKVGDGEAEAKRTKQLVVVFIDDNGNGVADVKERTQVEDLSPRGDEDGDNIRNFEEIGDPQVPNDTDKDGILDVFDLDSDDDGVSDESEAGDTDILTPPIDTDSDGVPDFQQVDADGDGILDSLDNCRVIVNPDQSDQDKNRIGDLCDSLDSINFQTRKNEGGCMSTGRRSVPFYSDFITFTFLMAFMCFFMRKRSLIYIIFIALTFLGCVDKDDEIELNVNDIREYSRALCGVCEEGTYCNLDGKIEVCTLVNGCGQIQTQTACQNNTFCHQGACVQAPLITNIEQMTLEQEGSIINRPSLDILMLKHQLKNPENTTQDYIDISSIPSDSNIQVIPFEAFLRAIDGTRFQAPSSDKEVIAAALAGHGNRLDVSGLSAVISTSTNLFSGELFIVTMDAVLSPRASNSTGPVYLEAQNYFVAAVKLSGFTPWIGNGIRLHSTNSIPLSSKSGVGCGCLGGTSGLFCGDLSGGAPFPVCDDPNCPAFGKEIVAGCNNLSCPSFTGPFNTNKLNIINGPTITIPVQYSGYSYPNDQMTFRTNGYPVIGVKVFQDKTLSTMTATPSNMLYLGVSPILPEPVHRSSSCGVCNMVRCDISSDVIRTPGVISPISGIANDCNIQYGSVPKICTQISAIDSIGVSECAITTDMWDDNRPESPYNYCHIMGTPVSENACAENFSKPGYCNYVSAISGGECDAANYTLANQFWLDFLGCGQGKTPTHGVTCTESGACLDRGNGINFCFECDSTGSCRQKINRNFLDERKEGGYITGTDQDSNGQCNTNRCKELEAAINGSSHEKRGEVYQCVLNGDSYYCYGIDVVPEGQPNPPPICEGRTACLNYFRGNEASQNNTAKPKVKEEPKGDGEKDTPTGKNNGQTPEERRKIEAEVRRGRAVAVGESVDLRPTQATYLFAQYGMGQEVSTKPTEATGSGAKIEDKKAAGDPVFLASGELFVHHIDMTFPGPVRPFIFERKYRSGSNQRTVLGSNWSSNFDMRVVPLHADNMPNWVPQYCSALAPETSCALVYDKDGVPRLFMLDAGSYDRFGVTIFMPTAGSTDTLYMRNNRWDLRSADGHLLTFDIHGSLSSDRDRLGNGFTVVQEPTPLYSLYYRYCKMSSLYIDSNSIIQPIQWSPTNLSYYEAVMNYVQNIGQESANSKICDQIGYMLNDRKKPLFTDEGLPSHWQLPVEQSNIKPKIWELEAGLADDAHAVRITRSRTWFAKLLITGPLPIPQTGPQRMRPKMVRDDLGRTFDFEYEDDPVSPNFGLLKQITGPAGARVFFHYDSPLDHPVRLNERFLARVDRKDNGNDPHVENTTQRRIYFTYAWQEPSLGGVLTTTEHNDLRDKFFAVYGATQSCGKQQNSAGKSVCSSAGGETGVCDGGVMIHGPASPSFCVGSTNPSGHASSGNPCIESIIDADDYQSAITDNLVRISYNVGTDEEFIEVESKYQDDVFNDNFDRVISQRYGGSPISEYNGLYVNNTTSGSGWDSQYPSYIIDYLSSKPMITISGGYNGDITDSASVAPHVVAASTDFLPQEIRNRYPLEQLPSYAYSEGFGRESILNNIVGESQTTNMTFTNNCDVGTYESTYKYYITNEQGVNLVSNMEYACAWQTARIARRLLPGYVPVLAYYPLYRDQSATTGIQSTPSSNASQQSSPQKSYAQDEEPGRIVRSRLTCAQLARGQTEDAAHNGTIEIPDLGVPEDESDDEWVFVADKRLDIEDNLRRICSWARVIDRDGRTSIFGLNYKGQELVAISSDDAGTGYIYKETLYNADGFIRSQRLPTTESTQSSQPPDLSYVYEQRESEWSPLWWTKRGNVVGIASRPVTGQQIIASWNPTPAALLNPSQRNLQLSMQQKMSIHIEYEPLYNQVRNVKSTIETSLNSYVVLNNTVYDYDYMEMDRNGTNFCNVLINLKQWGFPFFGTIDETDPNSPIITCDSGSVGDWLTRYNFYNKDINGDGVIGTKNGLGSSIFSALGLPIRIVQEDSYANQKIYTWTVYNGAGQPVRTSNSSGSEKLMRYYSASNFGSFNKPEFYGYDVNGDIPEAFSYERGLLAEVLTRRFTSNIPLSESPPTPYIGCNQLAAPYQWILPHGCGASGPIAALEHLGVSQELINVLMDASTPADDTTRWASLKMRYSQAGHITELIQDGRKIDFHHDLDGKVLVQTSPEGVLTEHTYNLAGHLKRILVHDGITLFSDTWFEYDTEGKLLTQCREVQYGNTLNCAQIVSPAGNVAYDMIRVQDDPSILITTYRYTGEGLPWKMMMPDGTEQRIIYTGRGLPKHIRHHVDGGIWRGKEFVYNIYGQPLKIKYTSSSSQALPVPYLEEILSYDNLHRIKSHTDLRGVTKQFVYNEYGKQSAAKISNIPYGINYNPTAWEVLTAYDNFGRTVAVNEHGLRISQNFWGTQTGNLYATEVSGAGKRWRTYDAQGTIVWEMDAEGNQEAQWSRLDLSQYGLSLGASSDKFGGLPTSYIVNTYKHLRSQDGHLIEQNVIGQQGETQSIFYNPNGVGQLMSWINPDGLTTHYERNLLGWPTLIVREKELGTNNEDRQGAIYDARGQITFLQDYKQGKSLPPDITRLVYNGFGDVESKYLPSDYLNPHTSFYYDGIGRLSTKLVRRDNIGGVDEFSYNYDGAGDLVQIDINSNVHQSFKYDYLGRLAESIDYNNKIVNIASGEQTVKRVHTFDALGRLSRNRLAFMAKSNVTHQYDVDYVHGLMTDGIRTQVTYPSGQDILKYTDRSGRMTQLYFGGRSVQGSWLGGVNLGRTQTLSNSAQTDPLREVRDYDGLGRLSALTYRAVDLDSQQQPVQPNWGEIYCQGIWKNDCAVPLAHTEYKRDVMGRVVSKHRKMGHVDPKAPHKRRSSWAGYDYNGQGHLTHEWLSDEVALSVHQALPNHQTDAVDNIAAQLDFIATNVVSQDRLWEREPHTGSLQGVTELNNSDVLWQHNGQRAPGYYLNSLTLDGGQNSFVVRYDGQGNVQHDGRHDYLYDATGRLVAALLPGTCIGSVNCNPPQYTVVELYVYDASNTLVKVIDPNEDTQTAFVHDGVQIISAYDMNNQNLKWETVWGAELDELVWWGPSLTQFTGIAMLRDERNSPMGLWSEDANQLVEIPEYSAIGELKLWQQNEEQTTCTEEGTVGICIIEVNGQAFPFGFNMAWRSQRTGLYNMRARWYSPELGEFVSQDPLGYIDSTNMYAFATFDPINGWDPFGLSSKGHGDVSPWRLIVYGREINTYVPTHINHTAILLINEKTNERKYLSYGQSDIYITDKYGRVLTNYSVISKLNEVESLPSEPSLQFEGDRTLMNIITNGQIENYSDLGRITYGQLAKLNDTEKRLRFDGSSGYLYRAMPDYSLWRNRTKLNNNKIAYVFNCNSVTATYLHDMGIAKPSWFKGEFQYQGEQYIMTEGTKLRGSGSTNKAELNFVEKAADKIVGGIIDIVGGE